MLKTPQKIIFILSGGLDSTVSLYSAFSKYKVVEAVTFDYDQRHRREISSARKICKRLKISHRVIDIKNLNPLLQGSSLTTRSIATPHGHYTNKNMKKTIVPNRNAIMINIAAGYAISKKIYALGLGVHAGDHYIYPDCRPAYIQSQTQTLKLANECEFKLFTPFVNKNKANVVKAGIKLGVPFELTWTCYEGGQKPCTQCASCVARQEAFTLNKMQDPLK